MRYIDLCPSAKMIAKKEVIENTKVFKSFKTESESLLSSIISDPVKIELSFSIGATLLELTLTDTDSTLIAIVKNGEINVQWSSYLRITNNTRKGKTIEKNLINLLKKDLLKIDKERAILLGYAPVSELEKYNYDSLGHII